MNARCMLFSVVLLFALVTSTTYSQLNFALGIKSGLNFSTLTADPDPYQGVSSISKSGRMNILVALQAQLMFARMFGIQVEPGYAVKSTRWEDTQGGKRTISVSEIQFPILFLVHFLQGPVQPYAFAGPNLGFVASASDKIETQGGTQDTDIKANVSSLDFAMDFGGGAKLKVANNVALTGDLRYSLGLTNLDNRQVPAGAQASTSKSRGLQILFGVLFLM